MQDTTAEHQEDIAQLIARIRERAFDPRRATDFAARHGIASVASPPVTPQHIAAAEDTLGVCFSPLLVALYTQVGNGGFGPAYGLVSLDEMVDADVRFYEQYSSGCLVKVCDWGCAIVSCLDFSRPNLPVVRAYMEIEDEAPSLRRWLENWLNDQPPFEERFTSFPH
jgi:hypothetical protein